MEQFRNFELNMDYIFKNYLLPIKIENVLELILKNRQMYN